MAAGADVRPEYSHSTINWVTAVFMVLFHVAAISAFWFFSWTNVITAIVLHWFAVGFGISLGYHRLHTHRGYKTSKAFEYFLAVCGTLSLEGGPIFWVATHRVHHQHSDHDGDPHTPHDGGFWAHMGWILFGDTHHNNTELMAKYAPDPPRGPPPQHPRADGEGPPRPRARAVLSLAEHLPLRAAHRARAAHAGGRR